MENKKPAEVLFCFLFFLHAELFRRWFDGLHLSKELYSSMTNKISCRQYYQRFKQRPGFYLGKRVVMMSQGVFMWDSNRNKRGSHFLFKVKGWEGFSTFNLKVRSRLPVCSFPTTHLLLVNQSLHVPSCFLSNCLFPGPLIFGWSVDFFCWICWDGWRAFLLSTHQK